MAELLLLLRRDIDRTKHGHVWNFLWKLGYVNVLGYFNNNWLRARSAIGLVLVDPRWGRGALLTDDWRATISAELRLPVFRLLGLFSDVLRLGWLGCLHFHFEFVELRADKAQVQLRNHWLVEAWHVWEMPQGLMRCWFSVLYWGSGAMLAWVLATVVSWVVAVGRGIEAVFITLHNLVQRTLSWSHIIFLYLQRRLARGPRR